MRWLTAIIFVLSALTLSCSQESRNTAPATPQKSGVELLKEKLKNDPKDADSWYQLAELYDRANLYTEEADALKRTLALKPDMGYAYFKLGTAYNRLGRYQDAVSSFTKATKYIRNQPMIYNNMAHAYGELGKTDDQIAALKKALSIRPKYIIARFNLGMAYLKKGDREEAMKQYTLLNMQDEGMALTLKKEIDAKKNKKP